MQLLSFKEALAKLNIGKTKLYELIQSGEIAVTRIGRCPKFLEEELNGYISRNTKTATREKKTPLARCQRHSQSSGRIDLW